MNLPLSLCLIVLLPIHLACMETASAPTSSNSCSTSGSSNSDSSSNGSTSCCSALTNDESECIDPLNDGMSKLQVIQTGGEDLSVVRAARLCCGDLCENLKQCGIKEEELIARLLKMHHTTPFEHTMLTFHVKAPITVQRQWMRHRLASYNEKSGRYCVLEPQCYMPSTWRAQNQKSKTRPIQIEKVDETVVKTYEHACTASIAAYKELLKAGVARELARNVLPLCLYTEFEFTCNLTALFHFLDLRSSPDAQWEIRQFATSMLYLAKKHFPICMAVYESAHPQALTPKS